MTSDNLVLLVEHHGPCEPVPTVDDDVVEFLDLGGPFVIHLVEVNVDEPVFVGLLFLGFDQVGCPKCSHSEVVAWVCPPSEVVIIGV